MQNRTETSHPDVGHLVCGHFREKKGYSVWRTRGTDDWLLIHTLDGLGRFGFAGGAILAEPGDLVLYRPGTLHDYSAEPSVSRWELLWTHFRPRPHWIEWLNWPTESPGLHRLRISNAVDQAQIASKFANVNRLTTVALRRRIELAMNALEEMLLWCDERNPLNQQSQIDVRIRDAMEYICANFAQPVTLESIAEAGGLSVSRLSHLFRSETGTTPQQFLELQRMNRARQLLEFTTRSVKEIAQDVGYENAFYFSSRFRKLTSKSPRDFRKDVDRRSV